jgi:hypothetical protein
MNYEQEKKDHISYCGSYCHICDWHTGKIRKTAKDALDMINEYKGFKSLLKGKIDIDNLIKGLNMLAESGICSGCKSEIGANERCRIRKCCSSRGFDLCSECPDFPCDILRNDPGVIKWHCLENLEEIEKIGLDKWIHKQWSQYINEK